MGHASERHDINSYATHSGKWIAFRQPVLREAARRAGKKVEFTYEVNPGEVWEEDEFWIELSWRIDPDGSLGIQKAFRISLIAKEKRLQSTSTISTFLNTPKVCLRLQPRRI